MNTLNKLLLRRTYIVDRKFQLNLLYRTSAFLLFVLLMMSAGLFLPLIREVKNDAAMENESYETVTALLYMHERFWPVALFCLAVSMVGTILISHRIAGPLVRVKRFLQAIIDGQFPTSLHTRKNDYLKHEVELLNTMVRVLDQRITGIQATQRELRGSIARCTETAEAYGNTAVQDAVAEVAACATSIGTQLDYFKTDDAPNLVSVASPEPAVVALGS